MRIPSLLTTVAMAAALATTASAHIVSETPGAYPTTGEIERLDPAFDALVAPGAQLEVLATGFTWSEGPAWDASQGALFFSDVPENTAYRWSAADGVSVAFFPSGYEGRVGEAPAYEGSNGLMFDADGKLYVCQHGNRQIAILNEDGSFTTHVSHFMGQRLNSPNDLVRDHAGNLYFSDPPYGLVDETEGKQLPFNGVYRLSPSGQVTLIYDVLLHPNGVALSPDERTLYIGSTDAAQPWITAITLNAQGNPVGEPRKFFEANLLLAEGREGLFDGLRVDTNGNVWSSGPGGVVVISPEGQHLGSLLTGRGTANLAWGGPNGTTLFITAADALLRIETQATWVGAGW